MRLGTLAAKNLLRNKFRTALTVLVVVLLIVVFLALRTVVTSWNSAIEGSAKDRVATRHKITFIMTLPKKYIEQVKQIPEVTDATYMSWFGAKHPTQETTFFANMAADAPSMLRVYDEIELPPEQRAAWLGNRRGAIAGKEIAQKFGWKVGDAVKLTGTIFPGTWEFELSGIYTSQSTALDEASFFFHWDYLNDTLGPRFRDQIGWIASRVDNPRQVAAVSKKIDALFDDRDIQTLSMSEKAMNMSFMGMFAALFTAFDVITIAILLIVMLLLGNTIAMGVRERTNEYGMLRAVGFLPRHIAQLILWEAFAIGLLGGLCGLLAGYPAVNGLVAAMAKGASPGMFPYFAIEPTVAVTAVGLAIALGVVGASLAAYRAAKLDVVSSLRRVD